MKCTIDTTFRTLTVCFYLSNTPKWLDEACYNSEPEELAVLGSMRFEVLPTEHTKKSKSKNLMIDPIPKSSRKSCLLLLTPCKSRNLAHQDGQKHNYDVFSSHWHQVILQIFC